MKSAVIVWAKGYEPVSAIQWEVDTGYPGARMRWGTSADLSECPYPYIGFEPTHWQPLPEPPHDP